MQLEQESSQLHSGMPSNVQPWPQEYSLFSSNSRINFEDRSQQSLLNIQSVNNQASEMRQYQMNFQNQSIQIQSQESQMENVRNNQEIQPPQLTIQQYKKNFLPIYLKGYELFLKKRTKNQPNQQSSLYDQVTHIFDNPLDHQRKKYGVKIIRSLLEWEKGSKQSFKVYASINQYRRTYAPLYFMKKIPKNGDVEKLNNIYIYLNLLKQPFPSQELQDIIEKKTRVIKIQKSICQKEKIIVNKEKKNRSCSQDSKDSNYSKDGNEKNNSNKNSKNVYRFILRKLKQILNKKHEKYGENQKGLVDFIKCNGSNLKANHGVIQVFEQAKKTSSNKTQTNNLEKLLEQIKNIK